VGEIGERGTSKVSPFGGRVVRRVLRAVLGPLPEEPEEKTERKERVLRRAMA
jgi:hypothetical protein